MPAGAKIQIGSLVLGVLNASAQKLPPAPLQAEIFPQTPPAPAPVLASNPDAVSQETGRPKKKMSWLRRWQRSLEMRENALMTTQNWGPPPVAPVVQAPSADNASATLISSANNPAAVSDPKWRELEEWIQSAREQAEACARERTRLEELQSQLSRHEEQIRKGQADLDSAWAQFHQTDRLTREEWHEGLHNLELARKAIADQAASLKAYRLHLESEDATNPESVPIHEPTVRTDSPGSHSTRLEAQSTHTASHSLLIQGFQPTDAPPSQVPIPDMGEVNAQIASLWNQLETHQTATHNAGLHDSSAVLPVVATEHLVEAASDRQVAPEIEEPDLQQELQGPQTIASALPPTDQENLDPGAEDSADQDALAGEDLENFLPAPDEFEAEAFRHWCQERLEIAARDAEGAPDFVDAMDHPAEEKSHRHGFARKLLEQGIATPQLLSPFTRLAHRRGVALEDILTRLNVFTTHQIATIGLGCANDLVLGRWYILDLPGSESSEMDRELVFRVFDPKDQATRILRVLAPAEAKIPSRASDYRARHEACLHLDSEHLVANVEVTELNGLPCVLQEEWTGTPCESWPPMGGSATVWYRLFLQAAIALRDLHQSGLHHGYLAPHHFLLKPEGLLRLTGHANPLWLVTGTNTENRGTAGDIADLARIGHTWWSGTNSDNQRNLPESLAGVLARMEQDHPEAISSSKALAEELDRAGILLPSGAAAWKRFLEEFSGPESSGEDQDEVGPEDNSEHFRRIA